MRTGRPVQNYFIYKITLKEEYVMELSKSHGNQFCKCSSNSF